MQSDSPESDPKLQRVNPGPKIATGYVDPCIVYLEATEKGEIPVLFAWWARSSSEIREMGATTHIKLDKVTVLKCKPIPSIRGWIMQDGNTQWNFTRHDITGEMHLTQDDSGWRLKGVPFVGNAYGFQGSLKFIDAESDAYLHKLNTSGSSRSSFLYAEKVLSLAPVKWPSLVNAMASFKLRPISPRPVPAQSLFRRLISSVFKKNQKPVTA